jgi:hypothetical protein
MDMNQSDPLEPVDDGATLASHAGDELLYRALE